MKNCNYSAISMPYEAKTIARENNSKSVQIVKAMTKSLTTRKTVPPTFPKTETYRLTPIANRYPGDVADAILAAEAFSIVILLMLIIQAFLGVGAS